MAFTWTTIEDALIAWVRAGSALDADHVHWAQQAMPTPSGPYAKLRLGGMLAVGRDWVQTVTNPLVLADDVVESVDASANTLTLTAHAYLTGDGPIQATTTGTLPGGLALATGYYAIKTSANAIKLASTLANALAGVAIDLTGAGTGTHTLVDTAATFRVASELVTKVRGSRRIVLTIQVFAGAPHGAASPVALLEAVRTAAALPTRHEALRAAGVGVASFGPILSIDGVVGSSTFEPRGVLDVQINLASEVTEYSNFIETAAITNTLTGQTFTEDVGE